MPFTPTNLAEFLSGKNPEEFLNTPLTAKQSEAFQRPLPPGTVFPPNQVSSVIDLLKIDPNLKAGWGSAWNNFSEPESRSPDDREAKALIFTFGSGVGKFLIDRINIKSPEGLTREIVPDRVNGERNVSEIHLPGDYNSAKLGNLGTFIHEATHIWQRNTLLHQAGRGGEDYDYSYQQLSSLNLKVEEHAEAVREWFYVSYGRSKGLISVKEAWNYILPRFGFLSNDPMIDFQADPWRSAQNFDRFVNHFYTPVLDEIKDPNLLPPLVPELGQNIPNPAR